MKRLDTSDWSSLALSLADQWSRRWISAWGRPTSDLLSLFAASPVTNPLADASAHFFHDMSQGLVAPPKIVRELIFKIDDVAEATSPQFIKLPEGWDPENPPTLVEVVPIDVPNGDDIPLNPNNVMIRVEPSLDTLLSVALVDLQNRRPFLRPPASRENYLGALSDTAERALRPRFEARDRQGRRDATKQIDPEDSAQARDAGTRSTAATPGLYELHYRDDKGEAVSPFRVTIERV